MIMALRQFHENPELDNPLWKKYRKKPVVIEAFRMDPKSKATLKIRTLNGILTIQPGEFIVRGIKGELYPCRPDIFKKTYEEVK